MRFQILCTILALTASSAALPTSARADAMHYTTLGAKSGQLQPPELTVKHLRMGQSAQDKAAAEQAQAGEQKTFEDVWQRYRALAEGRAVEDEDNEKKTGMVPTQQRENKPYTAQRLNIARPASVTMPERPSVSSPASLAAQEPAAGTPSGESMPDYRETPLPDHVTARPMGILDQYEQSKARRSQMKTLRINPPSWDGYTMPKRAAQQNGITQQPSYTPPTPQASNEQGMLGAPGQEVHHLKMHPPQMTADAKP
ncbi:MAG: hypothetical protein LRY54_02210 [Alphaproteobacteria bacterium]|nr:hypothetical protein [Alphaproteobacteria bacterium]